MQSFRLKLRMNSSFITPFHSDAIFGALCWVVRSYHGEEALREFLEPFLRGDPTFIISNGFPEDYFPKPMIPFQGEPSDIGDKPKALAMAREGKRRKKITLLSLEEFNATIGGGYPDLVEKGELFADRAVMHSLVNRSSGTTSEGGELFTTIERFSGAKYWSVYVKAYRGWEEKILELFTILGKTGFGKRKSVGKGSFDVISMEPFDFKSPDNANAFVLLSNYIPASEDPTQGFYKTFVKYGKLDGDFAQGENPFKVPLLMMIPGSVFLTNDPRPYYGRMVKQVSQAHPEVVHYGYGFSVPAYVKSERTEVNV